ncbi:unnamed protein product [marine sediment metagenome]|uniref:Uncharacterized protein n=1 Tax=marine sediment metagenome TaxID=412755 RepID=X1GI54_9ZZZZ
MNDNEVMSLAEKVLPEHKMLPIFSHRYAFLLGWRVIEEDIASKFKILEFRAYLIADELEELFNCQTSQSENSEDA